jgi:hypothetical protein
LSEWREEQEAAECLSIKELLERAGRIEKILDERHWREDTLSSGTATEIEEEYHPANGKAKPAAVAPVMSEIFFNAAKVLLATVLHGPSPRGQSRRPGLPIRVDE